MKRTKIPAGMHSEVRRVGNGKLKAFINTSDPTAGDLPLTHATDGYGLREIIEAGSIKPSDCKVFNEPILYLFYGRPAYRPNGGRADAPSLSAYAPTCFVLPPLTVTINRIFPFDSGAFKRGAMDGHKHHSMNLEDFLLEPDANTPRRLVRLFYGDLESYFLNKPLADPRYPASVMEAEAYHSLARSEGNKGLDERATTIELHTANEIALAGGISAVVLPENLLSDSAIRDPLKKTGATLIPYDYIRQSRPGEYAGLFYDRIKSHYKAMGWL